MLVKFLPCIRTFTFEISPTFNQICYEIYIFMIFIIKFRSFVNLLQFLNYFRCFIVQVVVAWKSYFLLHMHLYIILLYIQVLHAFEFYQRKVFYIQTSPLFLFNCYFTLHPPMHLIILSLRKKELLLFFSFEESLRRGLFFR